jgi:hypothetical protein
MFMQSVTRVLAVLFCSALFGVSCLAQTAAGGADEGVQIEFPVGGQVRIENNLGDITAEIWKQKYIYVTTVKGPLRQEARPR